MHKYHHGLLPNCVNEMFSPNNTSKRIIDEIYLNTTLHSPCCKILLSYYIKHCTLSLSSCREKSSYCCPCRIGDCSSSCMSVINCNSFSNSSTNLTGTFENTTRVTWLVTMKEVALVEAVADMGDESLSGDGVS